MTPAISTPTLSRSTSNISGYSVNGAYSYYLICQYSPRITTMQQKILSIFERHTAYPVKDNITISLTGSENMVKPCVRKLYSFLRFKENWNGYDAAPFSPQLIQKVTELMAALPYDPEVFPIADGQVQLEYEKANGEYLEFEIGQSDDGFIVNGYKICADGEEEKWTQALNVNDIARMVRDFYG